jgi:hypothetical protein
VDPPNDGNNLSFKYSQWQQPPPPPIFPPTTPKSPDFLVKSASATPIAPCWNFIGMHSIYLLFSSEIGDLQTPKAQQLVTIINALPPKYHKKPEKLSNLSLPH